MSPITAAHRHRVGDDCFEQGYCQVKDNKMPQELLEEESASGSKKPAKYRIRNREISQIPHPNRISNREGHSISKRHHAYLREEQGPHLSHADRFKRGRIVRQGSGFILQPPGLARVSSDPIDRPIRKRIPVDKSSLRVNTLVLRSHGSPFYQQPLASPTSPTFSSYSLQPSSSSSYQETPSPPLQRPLFQNLSSRSQFFSYENSSATATEADNFSVLDRKKLSVSSASSVPSVLSTHMPTDVVNPIVIDWTSPSTRRREYREIDRCNRGFRRAWKTIAPRCCWCKSWRRDFYVGPKGYDGELQDEIDGKGGDDAESVRRYRLHLVDDDDGDENCDKGSGEGDGDFDNDDDDIKDEKKGIVEKKMKSRPKGEGRTFLGSIKCRLYRAASRDNNIDDLNSAEKQHNDTTTKARTKSQVAKPEMKEKKQKREEKKMKKKRVFGEGLICFQLHEIPH